MKRGPVVWTLDIETFPIEAYVWDIWEQNVGLNQIKEEWSIASYCAKRLGSSEIRYEDTGGRGKTKTRDDSKLLPGLRRLLDEADIIIAQNGKKFDLRKIRARFLMAGIKPPSPVRVIDTKIAVKKVAAVTSTRLEWLAKYLTDTPKSEHKKFPGFELWLECLADNPAAWAEMRRYNKIDVVSTEKLYLRLRPWMDDHPNLATYGPTDKPQCIACASENLQPRGQHVTQQNAFNRYVCGDCGKWGHTKASLLTKAERQALLVN